MRNRAAVIACCAAVLLLVWPEASIAADEGHNGGNQLVDLGWRVLNFIIFAAILYFAAAKPIRYFLNGRVEDIRKQIADADRAKDEAEKRLKDCLLRLESLDDEIMEIKDTLRKEGEVERDRVIEAANAAAEKIKAQASFSAEQELARAVAAIRKEAADAAVELAEKLLADRMGRDDHARLASEYVSSLGVGN